MEYLLGSDIDQASIAKMMSWASKRTTTRMEDIAYCLLGIFGVNMPLLYGEREKAFIRLQEEIMKNSDDQSLFAWGYTIDPRISHSEEFNGVFYHVTLEEPNNSVWGYHSSNTDYGDEEVSRRRAFLAESPSDFQFCGDIVRDELGKPPRPYSMTNKGLQMELPIIRVPSSQELLAILACRPEGDLLLVTAIPIRRLNKDKFVRSGWKKPFLLRRDEIGYAEAPQPLYFYREFPQEDLSGTKTTPASALFIRKMLFGKIYSIFSVETPERWEPRQRLIHQSPSPSAIEKHTIRL
jgi:hypothetical protein